MKLETNLIMTKKLVNYVNNIAHEISMTISSQGPRAVPTNIVVNNLDSVQRLGSEICINNLPTSAQQLKHKVIKVCEECNKIELTSKYNFKSSFEKHSKVLCIECSQNTKAEYVRRSKLQLERMKNKEYKNNAIKNLIGPVDEYEEKAKLFCKNNNIAFEEFRGFRTYGRDRYSIDFNNLLKFEVRDRQNNKCLLCGKEEPTKKLDVHHIDFDGFNNQTNNLAGLCRSCHSFIKTKDCELNLQVKTLVEDIVRTYVKA